MSNIKFASTSALPTEQQMQVMELQRRQAMADALRQQALEAPSGGGMVGNIYVAPSWTQGLAQLGKAYFGSKADAKVTEEMRALAKKGEDATNQTIARLSNASQGLPAAFNAEQPETPSWMGEQSGPKPASQADRVRMMRDVLMSSGNPEFRNAGVASMLSALTKDPKYEVVERFNDKTGQKEKVLLDMNNPTTAVPFGGQESRPLSFQNTGPNIVGLDPFTGRQVSTTETGMSPDASARLGFDAFKFGNLSATDRVQAEQRNASLNMESGRLNYDTGMSGGGVPLPPQGAPFQVPGAPQAPQMQPQAAPVARPTMAPAQMLRQPAQQPTRPPGTPMSAPALPQPVAATGPVSAAQSLPPRARDQATLDQMKRDAEQRAGMPAATASVGTAMQNLDRLADMAADLQRAPGLKNILGPISQYQITDQWETTRDARALANAVKNQVGTTVLQAMRDASKTGGAVGSVTEKEWPILQQNLAALDLAQTEEGYRLALVNLQNQLAGMRSRLTTTYRQQYGADPAYDRPTYVPMNPVNPGQPDPAVEAALRKYGGKR